MRVEQLHWDASHGWDKSPSLTEAQWVLIFGGTEQLDPGQLEAIHAFYPGALGLGCSTSGEIWGNRVTDGSIIVTAVAFAKTRLRLANLDIVTAGYSRHAGETLAKELLSPDLKHVFLLSDGLGINGSELVDGLKSVLPVGVEVTGGLSGDGTRFQQTLVIADGTARAGRIAALGLYGEALKVGYGCLGGWNAFGPDRLITKSSGNVLFELDGHSALALYKKHLGHHSADLPAAGLLFPLSLSDTPNAETGLVRTILAVDEKNQSMTFAGDMPEGMHARLMRANLDRLVDGAAGAAEASLIPLSGRPPELAILISCVGRRLVLKQRTDEEIGVVRGILGSNPTLTGFYSYGEISPSGPTNRCELHNQTMTVTTLSER